MKKLDLYARSFSEIIEKLEAALSEGLKVIKESDPEFGYIRLAINNEVSIFIRMLPTFDYMDESDAYYVNAYIYYVKNKEKKEALFFSERYDSEFFDINIQRLISEICKIFKFSINGDEFNIEFVYGSKTYKYVELETMYPTVIKDNLTFSKFLAKLVRKLNIKNPTITAIFHLNVAGNQLSKSYPIYTDGSFFISFTYNDALSDSYEEPIYVVAGEVPSIFTDVGRNVISEVLLDEELESFIMRQTRWYFSIKEVLTFGESVACYIQEKPYFQKII